MNRTLSPQRRCAATRSGVSSLHGGHHEPQKFTTTGVPRCCATRAAKVVGSIVGSSVALAAAATPTARLACPSPPQAARITRSATREQDPRGPSCHAGMVEPQTVKDRPCR